MLIAICLGACEPRGKRLPRRLHVIQLLERLRFVVIGVAGIGIDGDRPVEVFDRLIVLPQLGEFHCQSIQTERIVRIGVQHALELLDAVAHIGQVQRFDGTLRIMILHSLALRLGILALAMMTLEGCASKPKAPPKPATLRVLRLTHSAGGAHHRTLVHQGTWYQTFGNSLLVVNPATATVIRELELGKLGETGPAVDMALDDMAKRLLVIVEDDQLVELDLESPDSPTIAKRTSAQELGIRPRRFSKIDAELYISGPGGVVRLSDRKRVFATAEDVGRIAMSADGLVACVGRQVRRMADDRYIGSATDLLPLPDAGQSVDGPTAIFTLQAAEAAIVGLMSPHLRELENPAAKAAFPGAVRRVKLIGNQVWVVGENAIVRYSINQDSLIEQQRIEIMGANDVDRLKENDLAIAGSFGRAVHRTDSSGKGSFIAMHREPGRLLRAATDGQHILADGGEGVWQYLINSRIELSPKQFETQPPPAPRRAATIMAQASISADGKSVSIVPSSGSTVEAWSYSEPQATIRCIAAVDGDFWIGHSRGITVLRAGGAMSPADDVSKNRKPGRALDPVIGQLRVAGPVNYIYPLLIGGGVSYVSESGGFGVAQFVDEPTADAKR